MILIDLIKKYNEQELYKTLNFDFLDSYDKGYRSIYKKYHNETDKIYELGYISVYIRFLNEAVIFFRRIDHNYTIIEKEDLENDNDYLVLKYGKALLEEIGETQ